MAAGTISARTMVASTMSATTMPTPSIFISTMSPVANAPITTPSSSAAEVMIRPVDWTPLATESSWSPVASQRSRTREIRNTS